MEGKSAVRTLLHALIGGAVTLLVYYLAAVVRGPEVEYIQWNTTHALVLTVLGLAAGAAWGSRQALERWKTLEVILVANLALVFGLLFLGWGFVWKVAKPLNTLFPGTRDLVYGFWFIASIVAAYIIRKPGTALAAETLAALAEFLAGGEWGLTLLISGIVQGGMAEIVFAATGYKRYDLPTLMLAGAAAGIGSLVVDYMFWYYDLSLNVLAIMLVARLISGAVLSGWLGKAIGDGLYRAGALGSFAIAREE
ncbi:MAG TPA: thiamine permease [Anaerolineae bacterium]|nr:thiamine permease [Anaerolineae bacterium]HIQ09010.1 thiamine permease [Anaerolineaceae bacterium]